MAPPKKVKREDFIREKLMEANNEPNERQLAWAVAFCSATNSRTYRNSTASAKVAGYPDPVQGGDLCYSEMGEVVDAIVEEEKNKGAIAVINGLWRKTQAKTTKVISHQGLVTDMIELEDNAAQIAAYKELAEHYGLKAPTKSEVALTHKGIADELREAAARAGVDSE